MQGNTPQGVGGSDPAAQKSSLSLVILGVLLSLIIKSALDHSFGGMSQYDSLTAVRKRITGDPWRVFMMLFQLLVFLFTLFRFYLGAYRYAECTRTTGVQQAVATAIGTCLLFSGFYVASLTLHSTPVFLAVVVAFHVLDFAWFFLAAELLRVPRALQALVGMWKVFDIVTVVSIIVLLVLPISSRCGEASSLGALLVVGVVDMWWFSQFYVSAPDWEKSRYIAWKSGSS